MDNEDVLERLIGLHPALFRATPLPCPSRLPVGWFALLDSLCCQIELLLDLDGASRFRPLQIKEKLGLLRIYFAYVEVSKSSPEGEAQAVVSREQISALIDRAVERSELTCCECGAPGKIRRRDGWLLTLCNTHEQVWEPTRLR